MKKIAISIVSNDKDIITSAMKLGTPVALLIASAPIKIEAINTALMITPVSYTHLTLPTKA